MTKKNTDRDAERVPATPAGRHAPEPSREPEPARPAAPGDNIKSDGQAPAKDTDIRPDDDPDIARAQRTTSQAVSPLVEVQTGAGRRPRRAEPKRETELVRVRALQTGYAGNVRRREGDVFDFELAVGAELPLWVEEADAVKEELPAPRRRQAGTGDTARRRVDEDVI